MDYRDILKKYMRFVGDEEGITFVSRLRIRGMMGEVKPVDGFTEDEVKELEAIEAELDG
jgi:hypothetical protein